MIENLRWLLLGLTGVLFFADLVQSFFYLRAADAAESHPRTLPNSPASQLPNFPTSQLSNSPTPSDHMSHGLYYSCLFAFFGAMVFAILAPSLPLLWVAVELTTLVSAPLIAYHRTAGSLEAMWKYILICSIGIGLALFGTMLVMHAQTTGSVMWHKTGFAFVLAGYGTKMGLAPFHTWLPDAHSEAPAPVSALLSGALLNCSFLAIARFREVMPAGAGPFCDGALLALGILSVAVAAVFMVRQTDFKRLLAYSSVEHMGIVATLFALYWRLGGPSVESRSADLVGLAIFGHVVVHSLTKTALFLTAGNLLLSYGTRAIAAVQGLGTAMKGHAALWIAGTLLICGMPPSILFLTELGLVVSAPVWVSATVLLLLFIVFAAMVRAALGMVMGEVKAQPTPLPKLHALVPSVLVSALVAGGVVFTALTVLDVMRGGAL